MNEQNTSLTRSSILQLKKVSLRGASAREISRDALLDKVSQEREHRKFLRRAATAALFIQRVWRCYNVTKKMAIQFREEWEGMMNGNEGLVSASLISSCVLRPFIFFVTCLSTRHKKIHPRDAVCTHSCFEFLLRSIHSSDSVMNFCSMALGSKEEKRIWAYQAKQLSCLCLFILVQYGNSHSERQDIFAVTSLAMRLLVALTDQKTWGIIVDSGIMEAAEAANDLIWFMANCRCGLYVSIRRYINKVNYSIGNELITASVITLAVRPFHVLNLNSMCSRSLEMKRAVAQYCLLVLTVPWLTLCLPAVLVPPLKHKSVLFPCLRAMLTWRDMSTEMSKMDQSIIHHPSMMVPPVGWALANIISLASEWESHPIPVGFCQNLDYALYVQAVNALAENFLSWLSGGKSGRLNLNLANESCALKKLMDQLAPVCQQWHLLQLVKTTEVNSLRAQDVVYLYSHMLRIFSFLNPEAGSLPVLNTLSFTPHYVVNLWEALGTALFSPNWHAYIIGGVHRDGEENSTASKGGGNTWANIFHKLLGKSQQQLVAFPRSDHQSSSCSALYDLHRLCDMEEHLRFNLPLISKDAVYLLHLFCATYSHLLFILDDTEFYEKQVPFMLAQQQVIAMVVNTVVSHGLSHDGGLWNSHLMGYAIRCLHLMYERDSRRQFCPPCLWLSPSRKNWQAAAAAVRTESYLPNFTGPAMGSLIAVIPHVYPFEERVQKLREYINVDKMSQKKAGESGSGSHVLEIVIRRDHVVEDGFHKLSSLRSRLKSPIRILFVGELGLQEAGLDYGGLSKEFLTDISKVAFSPEYGLFSQTSTSDRLLLPNAAARFLENGIEMIEFLGRIVGKALYEGILLDFSFSPIFVQKLLGRYSFIDELSTVDPELYKNLMFMKHYNGDVRDLCLDFTTTEEVFDRRLSIDLKPGGKDVCVTNENKLQYVHAMADYRLNRQILPFSNAFYRGLTDLISPSWLNLFNAIEFNQLLSGGDHDIDFNDLRKNTRYTGGYTEKSRTVKYFWEVVQGLECNEQCLLLKFVTGCSRGPLLGFKHLEPHFTIQKVPCDVPLWAAIGGQDVERLPSASTCYNTLKLPAYRRASTLRAKLLYAVNSKTGFELS